MNRSAEQLQVYYEIAMSIGQSMNIYDMLKNSLLTYLRKLNCIAAMVYKIKQQDENLFLFEEYFSLPYTLNIKDRYSELHDIIPGSIDKKGLTAFMEKFPIAGSFANKQYYHIMSLGDFGILVLIRSESVLADEIIFSLEDINQKLTSACNSCLNYEALIESEEKHRELSEFMPVMICETNTRGIITYANKHAFDVMEYKRNDIVDRKHFLRLFHKDAHKEIKQDFKSLLNKESNHPMEYLAVTGQGKELSVLVHTKRMIRNGKTAGIRGLMIDISERKEIETRFRALSESTFESIFFSEKGICINQNATAEKVFGYTLDEAVGRPGTEWIHEDYRNLVIEHMMAGNENPYEAVALRKDGSTFPCEIQGKMTTYESKPVRITALRDISVRKEAEDAKRASEEKYSGIVNNANDGIYLLNEDGRIIFANKKFTEILDCNLDQILGKKSWEYLDSEINTSKDNKINFESETQTEKRVLTQSGKEVFLDIRTAPLHIQNQSKSVIGIIRDISERIEYEKQLTEERDKANIANKAKSEFLANMSHEIRTPMNAILGFSEALYHKLENQVHRKMVGSIVSSGNLLLALLNDILDLSKIESGKLEINPHPVNLETVMKEIQVLFINKARIKNLELSIAVSSNFPKVLLLDEIRIKQVLFNLVGNAIKFTHKGYVCVKLKYQEKGDKPGDLMIEVEDTGIGIAELQQELVFDAFIQQSGQSNRKYGGVGLGLAISKRLVEKMKGVISVSSQEGKGSVFSIHIPNVEISKQTVRSQMPQHIGQQIKFEDSRLLVVDDIHSNIEAIESLLDDTGIAVTSVDSGEAALEILNHFRPDVILLDIRMPGIDGFEVAKTIKSNAELADIPLIAFTASVIRSEIIEKSQNFNSYLYKPVKRAELMEQLSRYIEHSNSKATPAEDLPYSFNTENLPDRVVQKMPEICKKLKDEFLPRWETLKGQYILFEIEDFAKDLREFARKYKFQSLVDYSAKLLHEVEAVDLEFINVTLSEFPRIMKVLSKL